MVVHACPARRRDGPGNAIYNGFMLIPVTAKLKEALRSRGVESFHSPAARISALARFEPPCSIKWMQIENGCSLGAFSYAVSGYYSHVEIGRYVSIGEDVQVGRASHALTWVSTSPFLYLRQKLFDLGQEFEQSAEYHDYLPPPRPGAATTSLRKTVVGNDVYIGHGAMVMPGVTVGDGAIVAAMAVVTKDVPPYGVVAGNPARLLRMRFGAPTVAALLQSAWWRFAPWQLTDIDLSQPDEAAAALMDRAPQMTPYAPAIVAVDGLDS